MMSTITTALKSLFNHILDSIPTPHSTSTQGNAPPTSALQETTPPATAPLIPTVLWSPSQEGSSSLLPTRQMIRRPLGSLPTFELWVPIRKGAAEERRRKRKLSEDVEREEPPKKQNRTPIHSQCVHCGSHYCGFDCQRKDIIFHKEISSAKSVIEARIRDFQTNAKNAGYDTSILDDSFRKLTKLPSEISLLQDQDVMIFLCDLCFGCTRILEALSKKQDGSPKYGGGYTFEQVVEMTFRYFSVLFTAFHLALKRSLTITSPSSQTNLNILKAKERVIINFGVVQEIYPKITREKLSELLKDQSFFEFSSLSCLSGLSSPDGRRVYIQSNTTSKTRIIEHALMNSVLPLFEDLDPRSLSSETNPNMNIRGVTVEAGDYYENTV